MAEETVKRNSVGVIGLGKIGSGMVKNLLGKGFCVSVLDLDTDKVKQMAALGAQPARSPSAMARQCTHIFLSLFGAESVETVLFGTDGIATRPTAAGLTVVDTTTISPEKSRAVASRLAEASIHYLDAPITGGERGARDGTLFFMAGGDADAFDGCRPYLNAVAGHAVRVGDSGAGATAKMVNQLLMVAHMAGAAEALVYTETQGVDFGKVVEAINPQLAADRYVQVFGKRSREGRSEETVPADQCHYSALFLKDTRCILELCKKQPIAAAASLILQTAIERGTDGPFPWSFKTALDALQESENCLVA